MEVPKRRRISKSIKRASNETNEVLTLRPGELESLHALVTKPAALEKARKKAALHSIRQYTSHEKRLVVALRFGSLECFDRVVTKLCDMSR